jgi:hypothetical protein
MPPGGYACPQIMLSFFEFTTGAPHPLSTIYTVPLPIVFPVRLPSIEIEVLGDHILVSVQYCYNVLLRHVLKGIVDTRFAALISAVLRSLLSTSRLVDKKTSVEERRFARQRSES